MGTYSTRKKNLVITGSLLAITLILLQTVPIRAEVRRVLQQDRQDLITQLKDSDTINARWFWQWRDRTNGVFTFDQATTHSGMTRRINPPTSELWLLHRFNSRSIAASTDLLYRSDGTQASVLAVVQHDYPESRYVKLIQGSEFALYENNTNRQLLLLFVKHANELPQVDGLFDFTEAERKYLEKAFWINITILNK